MIDYEIWGPDDDGHQVNLGTGTGEVPGVGDTITVNGKDRDVKKVAKNHSGSGSVTRVSVGQYDDGEPMPIIVG